MATSTPAIEGWFTTGDQPALTGGRCTACGTWTFPARDGMCPNPHCAGQEVERLPLGRRGVVWSYATNHYDPPPPAVVQAPYTVVAVTIEEQGLTVLGLLDAGVEPDLLKVGAPVELVVRDLHVDDEGVTRTVWAWRPVEVAS